MSWENFGPPRNSLDAFLEEMGLLFVKNNEQYQLVFVFIDVVLESRSKAQFLSDEIANYSNASTVIFPLKNNINSINDEVSKIFQPVEYTVENISFTSIAQFMKDQFGMTMSESEVVATRLLSTFNNYRLNIHPTYLASIQKDTVHSFIDANQRGELIELAVAGLLSILVSDDKSKVVLRRGTRERFLSKLAVNIYSEKNSYTYEQLIDYADQYAQDMGFDIVPKQFVDLFLNNGILSIENHKVEICIPVIRSYMLAKGLVNEGKNAFSYFDFSETKFDFATFDLYCEFSNDPLLFDKVSDSLIESSTYFEKKIEKYEDCS